MRITCLTTETLHHAFFIRELAASFQIHSVFLETRRPRVPFDTRHPFESLRDDYERQLFFQGRPYSLESWAPVSSVDSLNDPSSLEAIARTRPDLLLVFGTGKLSRGVLSLCPEGILNLHGGDPEHYRGLDSHLWTIYHEDFKRLVTTLHRVNEALDDGPVIAQAPVPVTAGMKLYELRARNTEVCVSLVINCLRDFQARGTLAAAPQKCRGRYYSHMPAVLKSLCVEKFERYTHRL